MPKIRKISATASKSYLQRAFAISILCQGKTILENISWSNDSLASKKIVEQLGATIKETKKTLEISSEGLVFNNTNFNASESGLTVRMFAPILALHNDEITINGEGSLNNRPIEMIAEALNQLNVKVSCNEKHLPLNIQGPIKSGKITIDGSISSQLLTGLLITLPLVNGDSLITVTNLKSRPYIDMTIDVIRQFGVHIENRNYKTFLIKGNQKYKTTTYKIEGDWSSVAFFLVYGAVKGSLEIDNLNLNSLQADKEIIIALKKAGAKVSLKSSSIIIEKSDLNAFDFDATNCPDLFPPLVCLASQCEGETTIKGVSRLKHKESDRALVLQTEFKKMGIQISIKNDTMYIVGGKLKACIIDSHHDHRIAMSGGIMNLLCEGNIEIENKDAINKSYPSFFNELYSLSDM